jgi:hypothetical protein
MVNRTDAASRMGESQQFTVYINQEGAPRQPVSDQRRKTNSTSYYLDDACASSRSSRARRWVEEVLDILFKAPALFNAHGQI